MAKEDRAGKRPQRKARQKTGGKTERGDVAVETLADATVPEYGPERESPRPKEPETPKEGFKSGFVAIIGLANAGKSTLVNRLVGRKVAIVSGKPQTTRNRITGIVHQPGAQIVLVDTPGLHRPETALGRHMLNEIEKGIEGVDVVAVIVDASREYRHEDRFPIERARRFSGRAFLLLNKIDKMPKEHLLPLIERYRKEHEWAEIIPISALTGDGTNDLLREVVRYLPEGAPYFPPDQYTDQPERFLAAEIVREKALALVRQEVPYGIGVVVERFEETEKLIRIYATILVEREGQRGILVGKGGGTIKTIGTEARKELEEILGAKLYLELFVKVQPNWRDNPSVVNQLDWRQELEQLTEE